MFFNFWRSEHVISNFFVVTQECLDGYLLQIQIILKFMALDLNCIFKKWKHISGSLISFMMIAFGAK